MSTSISATGVQGNRFYIGDFDEGMAEAIVPALRTEIAKQARIGNGLIEFWISSNGGYCSTLVQILELIELAKRKGVTVRTVVASHAYSCGSMLAISGTKGERYISHFANHLAHYGQFDGYRKSTPLQVERDAENFRHWTSLLLAHYQKHSNIPGLAEKLKDDHFWITAEQSIEWGLADKYMDELS